MARKPKVTKLPVEDLEVKEADIARMGGEIHSKPSEENVLNDLPLVKEE